ncbi:MAG: WhiB family transcriptional regulator [Actinomycetota bacterium]|jgi:WhiB family transcriptional regulator, redox-sensing transcriptional regulator|tara:strand:+ start:2858 stop:3190 length:333 start_codon:yes stop_codon:yes gene_type:complete
MNEWSGVEMTSQVQPRPIASDWAWQESAACRELPTEMFFYTDGERGPRRKNRENAAKTICAACPVIQACRKQALSLAEPYGIWGGLTEEDRLLILNRNQKTQAESFSTAS